MHDPATHADPMEFKPERFLGKNPEPEPRSTAFGHGRRICKYCYLSHLIAERTKQLMCRFLCCFLVGPGLLLAQSSLWLSCAMSLAVLKIDKYVDGFGNVVEPKIYYTDGTIRWVLA